MNDPVQLAILALIVACFAAFGVTLFSVTLYVSMSPRAEPEPEPRTVIPSRSAATADA